ncbi:uncharacterized protein LOC114852340 isoform X5 [Betta splendens]|uniref:Uncharacterized protein LOC114852340 isoform X5 n=1 Tax=Betta splendens TaxID=158456 RepID=A0A9W2Y0L5_BETSP|nr:uncharacterized protein LOC114852340 isoform X5 [Betta splendens]
MKRVWCPNQPSYQASLPPLPPLSEPLVGRVHPLALSVLRLNYDMPQQRQPQVLAEMESTLAAVMQHHNAQSNLSHADVGLFVAHAAHVQSVCEDVLVSSLQYQDHKAHKPTSCQANTSVSCRGAPQWGNPQVSKKLKRCPNQPSYQASLPPLPPLSEPLVGRVHPLALSVLRLNYDMPQQRQPQVLAEMESTLAAVMQHHNAQSNLSHADVGLFVAHAAHVQSVCEDVLVSSLQYQDHKAHKPTSCQANTSVSCRGAPQWGNPQVSKKLKRCPNQPSYQASLPPLPPLSEPLVGRVHPLALSVLRLNYDMPQQRQPQVLAEMESTLAAVMQHHNAQSNLSHAHVGLFVAHAAHVQSVCEDVLVSSLQYQDHKAHKPTSCQANTSVSCRGAPQWGNPQVSKKLKSWWRKRKRRMMVTMRRTRPEILKKRTVTHPQKICISENRSKLITIGK